VRVSGPRASDVMLALAGCGVEARRAVLRRLRDPERPADVIDDALVLWMPGPRSFTGEDVVEFHVHGGHAVVNALMSVLSRQSGVRPAEAGEFTRRAFEAGRLDLVAVEGLADLIAAESEAQHRQALFHQRGGASAVFEAWREELIGVLARYEAAIDFVDEDDVANAALKGVGKRIAALEREIREAMQSADQGARIREGVRVVIAGPPNSGKSTLLNRLAGYEAAIVSHIPGTTRDVIEVRMDLGGMMVMLADTAGLREGASDTIEIEGMIRARGRLAQADIVLWVESPDTMTETGARRFDSPALRIWNKVDLGLPGELSNYVPDVTISARTGEGVDKLIGRLADMVAEHYSSIEPALVSRDRHRKALEECCDELVRSGQARGSGLELEAEHMRLAARALGRLTGRIDVEDLLGAIFSEFCIGK